MGRDPERGVAVPQPPLDGIADLTADARGYGFHCTLKPPMRLATSYGAFRDDVSAMVQSLRAFDMPPLAVADLSGFLAVRETSPSPELQALADACVAWPDRHRAPPDTAELARRRGKGLPPDADQLLLRWGYPGVFGRWRFHMTLTRRLQSQTDWRPAADAHFAAALAHARRVESICIFTQAAAAPHSCSPSASNFPIDRMRTGAAFCGSGSDHAVSDVAVAELVRLWFFA